MSSLFEKEDEGFEKAYNYALRLLDYSPQTEMMLVNKMKLKKYPLEIIKLVVAKLTENNLLKDYEVASVYADNLVKLKSLGLNNITVKLRQKGIGGNLAAKIAREAIDNNGGEEVLIIKYIEKQVVDLKELHDKELVEKLKYKLVKKGFSLNRIREAINNLLA
jgi:SOS response regulatory protein OraA/RecX